MSAFPPVEEDLQAELARLRERLAEAEDTLAAIQQNRVDAFVLDGPRGKRVYVLEGADRPYRTLVEEMQEGALTLDAHGLILFCNASFARMLAGERGKLVATSLRDLIHAEDQPIWDALLRDAQSASARAELRLARSGLPPLPVLLSLDRMPADAGAWFAGVVTDLTPQIAQRRLEATTRRKDDFLAMLGHELRSPLASLSYAAEILSQSELSEGPPCLARDVIHRQVRHMLRLVEDLVDVSRIGHGKVVLRFERLDLCAAIRATIDDFRPSIRDASLELSIALPSHALWANADSTRLAQMVGNLLHNAVKFNAVGGTIRATLCEEAGGAAALAIEDNGAGFEPDLAPRLFQPFEQGGSARGGLGLGLAMVRGLAELHGGTVSASSSGPGTGARFVLRLPLAREPREAAKQQAREPSQIVTHRIVLIEDHHDSAAALELFLRGHGQEVHVASSGEDGLALVQELNPLLVLCDLDLGEGIDGFAVARALRADPRTRSIRLVALTGKSRKEDLQRAREAGFDSTWIKPVEFDALAALLGSLDPVASTPARHEPPESSSIHSAGMS